MRKGGYRVNARIENAGGDGYERKGKFILDIQCSEYAGDVVT